VSTTSFTIAYLLYVVLPLWVLVGAGDYLCHRATRIESTAGPLESIIHLLMMAETGLGLLLGLFLEIDALVILLMILCWILHEFTSYWDLSYAVPRRYVSAIEQKIHDYLAVIPFMALSFVIVLHWPQALALIGTGPEAPHFVLRLKAEPLPVGYVAALLATLLVFDLLPYVEELWRGWQAQRHEPARRG
jgi:hypothetical protein